jgi:hypothetical protein
MYGSGNLAFRRPELLEALDAPPLGSHGTFRPNHAERVHRWYPYLEGFSNTFVSSLIAEFGDGDRRLTIYDPFAGSGTTPFVAAAEGHAALYSEINPYMRLVIWAKTSALAELHGCTAELRAVIRAACSQARQCPVSEAESQAEISGTFPGRPYFDAARASQMVSLRRAIGSGSSATERMLRFMLGAVAVESSELKRAGDLRYRTGREKISEHYCAVDRFEALGETITEDLAQIHIQTGSVQLLTESALDSTDQCEFVDLVITSPPYINGTNYIRNAKLELWAAGFLQSEADLKPLRQMAVTAGICDVMKNGRAVVSVPNIEHTLHQLRANAYDRRIPVMVERYFSDATIWIANIRKYLKPGGRAVIDIGDSRFGGVHVPADLMLADIAGNLGFDLEEFRHVRPRRSKDGSPLQQTLLVLRAK